MAKGNTETVPEILRRAPGKFMERQQQKRLALRAKAEAERAKLQQGQKTASTPANMKKSKAESDAELAALRKKQAARTKK